MENSLSTPQRRIAWRPGLLLLGLLTSTLSGCVLHDWGLLPPPTPPLPAQSVEIRDEGLQVVKAPEEGTIQAKLAGARDYFRRERYYEAQILFHHVARQKKADASLVQEALFYEAECFRLQSLYPKAADTYKLLQQKYPRNPYRQAATRHMFEIANYWLDDTRLKMKAAKTDKSWLRRPHWFHWDKTKPFSDEEGRAIQLLEQVHFSDISGEEGLGPQALFLAGGVMYFNENYPEADHFFSQLHHQHPNHPLAPKAIEYALQAKQMSTGGPEYDGRKVEEARRLVGSAMRSYPELAKKKSEYLDRQMGTIMAQKAAKDFKKGEFYRRTGHPGSAYFYYELVRRRYGSTSYAQKASQRIEELRAKHPDLAMGPKSIPRSRDLPRVDEPQKKVQRAPQRDIPPPPPPSGSIAPPPGPLPSGLRDQ